MINDTSYDYIKIVATLQQNLLEKFKCKFCFFYNIHKNRSDIKNHSFLLNINHVLPNQIIK